jgi:hypothetical protein
VATETRVERRLIAVLAADVAGYWRRRSHLDHQAQFVFAL